MKLCIDCDYSVKLEGDADAKRAGEVAAAAERHGVDAALLARMEGDPEENAKFLEDRGGSQQRYPSTFDGGSQGDGAGGITAGIAGYYELVGGPEPPRKRSWCIGV